MSAQTGAVTPSGPVSQRVVDRARFRFDRLLAEPNPIWIRELRQAARLTRTPVILTVITILMTLLIASIGGLAATSKSPAETGVILFQFFFGLAYFVVTLVGPAIAANSIASEREGRTWEAVLLTGLPAGTIARGKFLASFTAITMYVVMLAPVGALPFLFGGVTATETIVAFAFLILVSALSVAFGLAISSKMASLRAAILLTLFAAVPMAMMAFGLFGSALSIAAHKAWPAVPEGPPIWLPTAYARADFGVEYVVFLVVLPIVIVTLPAWFLYEVTLANLTSVTDDRSTGLKRWFLVAAPAFAAIAIVPSFTVRSGDTIGAAVLGLSGMLLFFAFSVFLYQGEPIGPSRRVTARWDRVGAGRLRRFLGPGVMRASALQLIVGVGLLAVITGAGMTAVSARSSSYSAPDETADVFVLGAYGIAFYIFMVGLGAWLRVRAGAPMTARVLLFAIVFAIALGPWIVGAIAGLIVDGSNFDNDALVVAAPSPFFVIMMFEALKKTSHDHFIVAGAAAMFTWTGLGLILFGVASRRCGQVIAQHEAALVETDRLLDAEDEAARPRAEVEEQVPVEAEAEVAGAVG